MCGILALDTLVSVLAIVSDAFSFSNVPRIVIGILHFFFTAYLLHLIGRMVGERVVFGKAFTRWHFDVFLCGCFLWEIMLVGWYFAGLTGLTGDVWWGLDLSELVALLGVGWVAWWGPLEGQEWSQV